MVESDCGSFLPSIAGTESLSISSSSQLSSNDFVLDSVLRKLRPVPKLVLVSLASVLWTVQAADLAITLGQAEEIAVENDPEIKRYRHLHQKQHDLLFANRELPDPQFRSGVVNYPIEGGGFRYEGMTHAIVGVRQQIPPFGSRRANDTRLLGLADQLMFDADDRERSLRRDLRLAWLDIVFESRALELIRTSRAYFVDLVDVTRSLYSIGSQQQQDVFQAELELNRIDDQILERQQRIENTRLMIGSLIGRFDFQITTTDYPAEPELAIPTEPIAILECHPTMLALRALTYANDGSIKMISSMYRPTWTVDLGYGYRKGTTIQGSSRSDIVSATVSFSIPFLRNRKYDKQLDAARSNKAADELLKTRQLRTLHQRYSSALSDLGLLTQRIDAYKNQLVPRSDNLAQASLQAYRSKTTDFSNVVRSYISQVETKLAYEQLIAERHKTWAELNYLIGHDHQ